MPNLPRLLYIGDVPVESTVAGSALIYRLLQEYPVDRLCIVEGNIAKSQPQNRLPNVDYQALSVGYERLLRSRFVPLYTSYLFLTARRRSHQLTNLVKTFQPEAILTVAHGFSWITAAELAKKHNLPLHLIVHDDWLSLFKMIPFFKRIANKCFGEIYLQAESRLCVSPYMAKYYQSSYKLQSSVLYPSRAVDVPLFDNPPQIRDLKNKRFVVAYAGSINIQGYVDALVSLSLILERISGKLIIYSNLSKKDIIRTGLNKGNIDIRAIIPFKELIYILRQEVDVLFVPMTFEPYLKIHMELSFPSKLTDYTATGLPLLIWGPSYCSAIRWAKENPGVAEVVDNQEITSLADSIKKLAESPEYRYKLATNALKMGFNYFSHANVIQHFYQSITQKSHKSLDELEIDL